MVMVGLTCGVAAGAPDASADTARASAKIAGYSLSKVHRWLHEVALKRIDKDTGLYIADGRWNYRDTAADCYPFLVWAAHTVDKDALEGPVRKVLHAEIKLCNHLDRIPVPYDLRKKAKAPGNYDDMVFQASEYVKDGLIAIVEVTGKDEWFERMKGIEEDIWKHAKYDTPFGKIPSKNVEVNGEQIQALVRLYTMTGEKKFLTGPSAWAITTSPIPTTSPRVFATTAARSSAASACCWASSRRTTPPRPRPCYPACGRCSTRSSNAA